MKDKRKATLNKLDALSALMSKLDDRLGYRIKSSYNDNELKQVFDRLLKLQKEIEETLKLT